MSPVKREIRIVGFDDAPFSFRDRETMLIGAVFRGGMWMDGLITSKIRVDGTDATVKIIGAVNRSPHRQQLRIIMLDGITFGGFNVADIERINAGTGLPVIAVVREKPDLGAIREALAKFKDSGKRWRLMEKAGSLSPLEVVNPKTGKVKNIWFQNKGIAAEAAGRIIRMSSTRSFVPEPLRVAHIIGHGLGCCI
jgi:hypothetical protein